MVDLNKLKVGELIDSDSKYYFTVLYQNIDSNFRQKYNASLSDRTITYIDSDYMLLRMMYCDSVIIILNRCFK